MGKTATKTGRLDWKNDRYLERWLKPKSKGSRRIYKICFKRYVRFTKMTPEQLIKEKWEDQNKEPIEQTNKAEFRLLDFQRWLLAEYQKPSKFSKNGDRTMAPKSVVTMRGAIQSFYRANGVPLNMKVLGREGSMEGVTKRENETVKLTPELVEKLAYYAKTLRDKAIIWCMFQGGFDVSTVCSLNWEHVEDEIVNPPTVKIRENGETKKLGGCIAIKGLKRKKIGLGYTFDTFIYRTAIQHLKTYLRDRYGEDYYNRLKPKDPLFVNIYGKNAGDRYPPRELARNLRKIAPLSDIANGRLKLALKNPLRPHSLRASFSSRLKRAGCDPDLINYMMGHKIAHDRAYLEADRETYCKYAETALEPKGIPSDVETTLEEQGTTVKVLSNQLSEAQTQIRVLTSNLDELTEKYDKLFNYTSKLSMAILDHDLMKKLLKEKKFVDLEPLQE